MPLVVRAFPVLPGKEEDLRAFASELTGSRRPEAAEFFGIFGVRHESWHLQQTPNGALVIAVTDLADDPQKAAQAYAGSERPFDRWFKEQVYSLSGINPDLEPLGPPTEPIFDWCD
ncbi:MAG TPA: hypothetical protein VN783_11205 [Thermoanaerobaculia bacterium]|nr:hypothetical protein [Thermoanaerobaculia bacterium]